MAHLTEVSYPTLVEYANETFAGYCYPSAPKTAGAMNMVFTRPITMGKQSPYEQVASAIIATKARRADECQLFQSLLQCSEKAALVQPLNLAVSGVMQPGIFCVKDYLVPTPLYYDIGTAVFRELAARMKSAPKPESHTAVQNFKGIEEYTMGANESTQRSLGAVMYQETLLYLSTADAGLRFKDRSATKQSMANRNKALWEFARMLVAENTYAYL